RLLLILPNHEACKGRKALRIMHTLSLSGYRFDRYLRKRKGPGLKTIWIAPPSDEEPNYRRAMKLARPLARAASWTRDLGNTPPNDANPSWMAEQAAEMAERLGLSCEVLEESELAEMGMGGILAVGQGSKQQSRLVQLAGGSGKELVALVGKGVTFDTGGISIKPSSGMEEMKYDKVGACAVLGIVQALSELAIPIRFQACLPLVENMPGGSSYRPGDIIRTYSRKTVEIVDTDAEGRLILADALSLAAEKRPDYLIELSTLTGASVVALGHHGAALYSPDDVLADDLLEAAASSGERLWRMPLWSEFDKEMKGVQADLRNLGVRWGGANSAAAFLANFMGRVKRWAHLDIAGPAYQASREARKSGATGFGVGLVVDWLLAKTESF
ncbi:MAG: leucyl aminopeptidase, partial [Acidobacteriota bacterium]